MWMLGPVGFTAPWLLLGLAALPVLWLLLRAVPPAPVRRRFPGITLLLGLKDDEHETDRTPWWLLLLRMVAVAALIAGFAGPVLNPEPEAGGEGPLLVVVDATWADAGGWPLRMSRLAAAVDEAGRQGRPVAVVLSTDLPAEGPAFQAASAWEPRLAGLSPAPWEPSQAALEAFAAALPEGPFDTLWLSDGLERPGRAALAEAALARGALRVFQGGRPVMALRPARFEDGAIRVQAQRPQALGEESVQVLAIGPDPRGVERELGRVGLTFAAGETGAEAALSVPSELRNRLTRFAIEGVRSAGAVSLTDDTLRRRKVALLAPRRGREELQLLSPLHYLRQALAPTVDLIEGAAIEDLLKAAPEVMILADVAQFAGAERVALTEWVERGGLLVRFAGPRLAAAEDARGGDDPLLPVRLRAGGRVVGGAMSWDAPRSLRPFGPDTPFAGLEVPEDVRISAQVLAQPGADLAARTVAMLDDGTPLVTRAAVGSGAVVLFHVTANAEWSSLPLSGLFVQMLERLAISTRPETPDAADIEAQTWVPVQRIDAFGTLAPADGAAGVAGAALARALGVAGEGAVAPGPGPEAPPGLYGASDRLVALNAVAAGRELAPAVWPAAASVEGFAAPQSVPLGGFLLGLGLVVLAADVLAALALGGRLRRGGGALAALAGAAFLVAAALPGGARAQDAPDPRADELALRATREVVLAHVITGDPRVDEITAAGLRGLSLRLFQRTAVEPGPPVAVDIERDELAFFPMLYWPVTADQPIPSPEAYARLNAFLRGGGMIVFDTRDADIAGFGAASPAGRRLQALARPLDIPPLEPVPDDHVLTRTFYLLSEFPGRHNGRVWVEAAPADAELAEGMPFRRLNDGVSPVVIGGNDWAAAWAIDDQGIPLLPMARGYTGDRQREYATRFGINLVMHVLTGNYKSDQVHVPALLDRLGQ